MKMFFKGLCGLIFSCTSSLPVLLMSQNEALEKRSSFLCTRARERDQNYWTRFFTTSGGLVFISLLLLSWSCLLWGSRKVWRCLFMNFAFRKVCSKVCHLSRPLSFCFTSICFYIYCERARDWLANGATFFDEYWSLSQQPLSCQKKLFHSCSLRDTGPSKLGIYKTCLINQPIPYYTSIGSIHSSSTKYVKVFAKKICSFLLSW